MRELFNYKIFDYGDEKQIVFFSSPLERGSFDEDHKKYREPAESVIEVGSEYDESSVVCIKEVGYNDKYRSYKRTRDNLYDYARANDWEWFCTFTTSRTKVGDRYECYELLKKIRKWFNNYKTRHCPDLKYLFIPELHKDGAVHLHGLISNIDKKELKHVGHGVYVFQPYFKKFGACNFSKVKDTKRVSNYIMKYVQKDVDDEWTRITNVKTPEQRFYRQRYFVSNNVKKSEKEYINYEGSVGEFLQEYQQKGYKLMYSSTTSFGTLNINYLQVKRANNTTMEK